MAGVRGNPGPRKGDECGRGPAWLSPRQRPSPPSRRLRTLRNGASMTGATTHSPAIREHGCGTSGALFDRCRKGIHDQMLRHRTSQSGRDKSQNDGQTTGKGERIEARPAIWRRAPASDPGIACFRSRSLTPSASTWPFQSWTQMENTQAYRRRYSPGVTPKHPLNALQK